MSKRTLRRAVERQNRKANKLQLLVDSPVASLDVIPACPSLNNNPNEPDEVFADPTPENSIPEPQVASAASATPAQMAANQANAQLSTGPKSPKGKAVVAQNRRTHGLTGKFTILAHEHPEDYDALAQSIYSEHQPQSDTEQRLADAVIQHYWLMQRALHLQGELIAKAAGPTEVDSKRLSLFLRYQSTHERSYYKALRELQNIRKEKQKNEIGFESQNRHREAHEARVRLTHARAQNMEVDTACRQIMEAPLPGNTRIPLEEITQACGNAIATVVHNRYHAAAATRGQ